MENLKAFEKHQEKVIQEMHERYLIFYKKKKKKRFWNCNFGRKKWKFVKSTNEKWFLWNLMVKEHK